MKIKRTYLSGCTWCNASGFVNDYLGTISTPHITCPVCNGAKTIVVTEEYNGSYEVGDEFTDKLHRFASETPLSWKDHRKATGLTIREVAKETGISISTISRIENAKGEYMISTYIKLKRFYTKCNEQK